MLFTVTGITNKTLRGLMTGLLHRPYSMNQASYDLSRLARNGLITRIPARNRYTLTRDGPLFACFYTRVYDHVLRPLMAPDRPNASHRWPIRDEAISRGPAGPGPAGPRSSSSCPAASRCRAAAFSASSSAASCTEPMCSISRDPRREDHTIWTAAAPDAVFTVRTYATRRDYEARRRPTPECANPRPGSSKPAAHSATTEPIPLQ
jgi:hypothetical protein